MQNSNLDLCACFKLATFSLAPTWGIFIHFCPSRLVPCGISNLVLVSAEQVIEKAYKKLRLDALVIQQGRLTEGNASKVSPTVS